MDFNKMIFGDEPVAVCREENFIGDNKFSKELYGNLKPYTATKYYYMSDLHNPESALFSSLRYAMSSRDKKYNYKDSCCNGDNHICYETEMPTVRTSDYGNLGILPTSIKYIINFKFAKGVKRCYDNIADFLFYLIEWVPEVNVNILVSQHNVVAATIEIPVSLDSKDIEYIFKPVNILLRINSSNMHISSIGMFVWNVKFNKEFTDEFTKLRYDGLFTNKCIKLISDKYVSGFDDVLGVLTEKDVKENSSMFNVALEDNECTEKYLAKNKQYLAVALLQSTEVFTRFYENFLESAYNGCEYVKNTAFLRYSGNLYSLALLTRDFRGISTYDKSVCVVSKSGTKITRLSGHSVDLSGMPFIVIKATDKAFCKILKYASDSIGNAIKKFYFLQFSVRLENLDDRIINVVDHYAIFFDTKDPVIVATLYEKIFEYMFSLKTVVARNRKKEWSREFIFDFKTMSISVNYEEPESGPVDKSIAFRELVEKGTHELPLYNKMMQASCNRTAISNDFTSIDNNGQHDHEILGKHIIDCCNDALPIFLQEYFITE